MNEHTYSIVEANEDPKAARIEKGNLKVTFTLQDVENEQALLEKHLKEFRGQHEIESAKVSNIEDNHPFVKDLSEQDRFTVHMYQEAKAILHVLNERIPLFEKQLETSREEVDHICKVLDLGPKTEEEAVDEAVAKIVGDAE